MDIRRQQQQQSAALANFKEEVALRQRLAELDRGRAIVSAAVASEQAALFRRYNRRLAATRAALAKRSGDRESARRWRLRLQAASATPTERELERRDLQMVLQQRGQVRRGGSPQLTSQLLATVERRVVESSDRTADNQRLLELDSRRRAELRHPDRVREFCDALTRLRIVQDNSATSVSAADYYARSLTYHRADVASGQDVKEEEEDEAAAIVAVHQRPLTAGPARNLTFRGVKLPEGLAAF